jgi:3-hydroxymyristoyl/3-hydroxydecanoyl-(acyl carrier protein) dehydratase
MVGSRIANDWNLIGPTLKISSFETGIPKALQVAKLVLASGDVDSVLLLGYGMCGDAENYVWHKKYGHQFGLKYDSEQFFGDGFGAVVLARKDECERLEFRAYADVVDISIASSPSAEVRGSVIDTQRIEREISRGVSVDYKNIRYVELFGAIGKDESQIIVDACKGKFEFGSGRHIKIGSAIDVIGICEAGSAMASLIKTALAIYFQYLPGSPRAERSDPEKRKSGSRYWVGRGDRSALLIGLGMDDTYGSVTLVQNTNKMNCSRLTLPYFDIRLIPIYGESHKAIKEALAELVRRLGEPADLAEIAKAAYDKFLRQTSSNEIGGYAATLLGTCKEEVIDEIDTVLNYLSKHDELTMFKSNNGSCVAKYRLFSSSEAIAMLFPPFGTLDIVKQQETIFTFPELATLADETVGSGLVQLPSTLVSMFAIHILRERFGIYPGAAIGFSMGELNMALATKFLRISNDKRNDILKGDEENRNSVREKMGEMLGLFQKGGYVSSKYPGETENWATYYLHLTENEELGDLKKKILSRKNVYITIVGHSRAVIVAGDERECKSLISELKCFSTKIYQHGFAHTPFVEACMPRLKSLIKSLSLEIHEDDAFTLYSTYARRPVQIEFDSYIDDVAKSLCYPVEIDKMLLHAANQGVRLFIDTGIDRFCASIAEVVLKDSEVVIESMNAKQNSVERTIASMLATVVSTGVESDISSIFPKVAVKSNAKNIIAYVVNGETSVRWSKVNTQIKDQSVVGKNAFSELGSPSAALSYVKTVAGRREIEHLANQQRSIPIQIEHSNTLESSVSDISCLHNKYLILQRSYSDFIYGQLYNKLCMTGDLQLCVPTGDRVKDALTYEEVIEVSQGKPSSVLGPRYKELDGQKVRARLPLPPFLFITRIKSITAEFGKFGEAAIEGEYVATANRDFYQENISSSVMLHEISQCGILLLSYMGIDIVLPGERSYRALSGTIEYFNPINLFPGKVIYFSYKITSIISFKDRMIVNFAMDLFCGNLHVLTKTGVGGIFTKEDLLSSAKSLPQNGFNNNRTENSTSRQSVRVEPICNKTTFSDWDLLSLQNGRPSICFGHAMAEAVQEQLYPKALKMLDRVCRVDMKGGRFGNGYVETETDIDIDHWAFDVHFKNDPVFPGNILCAGAQQAALFYLTLVGLRRLSNVKLHRHEVLPNNPSSSRFLRQVSRSKCTVRYNLDIKWIGLEPSRIVWDYRVTLGGNLILRGENVGIRLMEFDE